jgi:DNA-binding NtrC family response regulator
MRSLRVLSPPHPEGPVTGDLLIGDSPGIADARGTLEAAARSGAHVLLRGEVGTGKELCARILHARSGRRGLFLSWGGGSVHDLHAALTSAAGGVLYVEELLDVRPETQAQLLRALDDGTSVQLVAATARDPENAAARVLLRAELLRALERTMIRLPALRERSGDIPLLVHHFLTTFCSRRCGCLQGVGEDAMQALTAYPWPGNVRELRAAVEHAVSAGDSPWITLRDLPPAVGGEAATRAAPDDYELPTLAGAEERLIRLTLQRFGGNKVRAARSLGISRHKLYERLRKLGLQDPRR